jgi:hypothetical protein
MTKDQAIRKLNKIQKMVLSDSVPNLKLRMDILAVLSNVPQEPSKRDRLPMRVCVNGVLYPSAEAAAESLKLYPITVRNRCKSSNEKFKAWTFVYTP